MEHHKLTGCVYFCHSKQAKLYFHELKKFPKGQHHSLCNMVIYYIILTPAAAGIIHLSPSSISGEQVNWKAWPVHWKQSSEKDGAAPLPAEQVLPSPALWDVSLPAAQCLEKGTQDPHKTLDSNWGSMLASAYKQIASIFLPPPSCKQNSSIHCRERPQINWSFPGVHVYQ